LKAGKLGFVEGARAAGRRPAFVPIIAGPVRHLRLANSRSPDSIRDPAAQLGALARPAEDAAASGLLLIASPECAIGVRARSVARITDPAS